MDHPPSVVYLEHDGKVLLVNSQGEGPCKPSMNNRGETKYRFPTESEVTRMNLKWEVKNTFNIFSTSVTKAQPVIDWPEEWAWKDECISDDAVHPIAREAIYRSIHRLVSKVVVMDADGSILMAKVKRGHFAGFWTLPGGYVDHDEHPRDGAVREAMEELGIEIEISSINSSIISQNIFTDEGISFVSVTYLVEMENTELDFTPKEDEIEEIGWFSRDEAMAQSVSWFDKTAISKLSQ